MSSRHVEGKLYAIVNAYKVNFFDASYVRVYSMRLRNSNQTHDLGIAHDVNSTYMSKLAPGNTAL